MLPVLGTLPARHPALRLELVEMEAEESLELLTRGEVDIVVAEEYDYAPRRATRRCRSATSAATRSCSCCRPDHPLCAADPETVAARRARGRALGVPARGHRVRTTSLVRACRALGGFEPDRRHRSNDLAVLEQLVAAGEAVALLPSLGRPGRVPGVCVRRAAEAQLDRRIFLAVRRGSTGRPAVKAVARALRDQAAALGLPGAV